MAAEYIPADIIHNRLAEVERSIAELRVEEKFLKNLLKAAKPAPPSRSSTSRPAVFYGGGEAKPLGEDSTQGPDNDDTPATTDVIIDHVRKHPGRSASEIATALKDEISTSSRTPRRIILNSIINLIHRNMLEKHSGRVFLYGQVPDHLYFDAEEAGDENSPTSGNSAG